MGQAWEHIPTSATWKGPPWDQLIQPRCSLPGEESGGKEREVRKGKQGGKGKKRNGGREKGKKKGSGQRKVGKKETGEREMRKGKWGGGVEGRKQRKGNNRRRREMRKGKQRERKEIGNGKQKKEGIREKEMGKRKSE